MTSAEEMPLGDFLHEERGPFVLAWPGEGVPVTIRGFYSESEWQAFINQLSLPHRIPQVIHQLYSRARRLHLLAWGNFDLIKAGELASFAALELALKDRYGEHLKARDRTLEPLLRYMLEHDGLTDQALPVSVRSGGSVVANFFGKAGLCAKRNSLAHGMVFDTLPTAGLLEIVRDLIAYAHRHATTELNVA